MNATTPTRHAPDPWSPFSQMSVVLRNYAIATNLFPPGPATQRQTSRPERMPSASPRQRQAPTTSKRSKTTRYGSQTRLTLTRFPPSGSPFSNGKPEGPQEHSLDTQRRSASVSKQPWAAKRLFRCRTMPASLPLPQPGASGLWRYIWKKVFISSSATLPSHPFRGSSLHRLLLVGSTQGPAASRSQCSNGSPRSRASYNRRLAPNQTPPTGLASCFLKVSTA